MLSPPSINQATAGPLADLLSHPPAENLYEALKVRLTATFGLSDRERASRLLRLRGLGDRKPSQLMDEMLTLMDGHKLCFLFEQLLIKKIRKQFVLRS